MENQILYDWVSITSKISSPQTFIEDLGLDKSGIIWEHIKGAHGYRDRMWWEKISIHYNGREDMGVWLEMSGQGCRAFETFGHGDYERLFGFVLDNPGEVNLTRLDIAYDDHDGILDISQIAEDTLHREYVSKFHKSQVVYSIDDRLEKWDGLSIYHGSPVSAARIRIYDKAAERGFTDGRHWVRVEEQLRDERAFYFIQQRQDIGVAFCGVLGNYLRYIDEPVGSMDCNRRRWPMKLYWSRLMDMVEPIRLYQKPGTEYNMINLENFVFRQAGGAIFTYLETHSVSEFLKAVRDRQTALNPKYVTLIEQFGSGRSDDWQSLIVGQ